MDLDRYNDAALREMRWFAERLRTEEIDALWRSGITLGAVGIQAILADERAAISKFMAMTPARRNRFLAKIPDIVERHGFLIAAAYMVRCGTAWLSLACNYGVSAGYSPEPRFLLNQAATAALDLRDAFPTLWPFEDHPDPFGPSEP